MPQNRFRQVMYNPDTEIPTFVKENFVPDTSGVEGVLAGYQAMSDKMYDIPIPKHMTYDSKDLESEYVNPIRELREQAVNALSTGKSSDGLRAMKALDRFIAEAKQPGGVYEGFESRYAQEVEQRKAVDKVATEKERQDMAPYLYTRLGYRPFRGEDGKIQSLAPSNYNMLLKAGELDDWINKQLPMIKETLKSSGYGNRYNLDQYTTLHEMRKDMGVDFNTVMATLYGRLPEQYKDAFRQEHMANRMYDPSLPDITEYDPAQIFELDDKGSPKVDKNGNYIAATTPLGQAFEAASLGYQHQERTSQYFTVKDDVGIDRGKKANDKEDEGSQTTLRTPAFISGTTLPTINFSNGNLTMGYTNPLTVPARNGFEIDPVTNDFKRNAKGNRIPVTSQPRQITIPARSAMESAQFKQSNPVGYDLWQKMKSQADAEKWDDKKIADEFSRMYKDIGDAMQTSDLQFKIYDYGTEGERTVKKNTVIGTEKNGVGSLGLIGNQVWYVNEPGKPTRVTTAQEYLKDLGVKPAYFINASTLLGELDPGANPLYPSGYNINFTYTKSSDKEKNYQQTVQIFTTPQNLEDAANNFPAFEIASPAFDVSKQRSEIVRPNLQYAQDAPEGTKNFLYSLSDGIYSIGEQRWQSDLALEKIQQLENIKSQRPNKQLGKEEQKEYDAAYEQYADLTDHPAKDKFIGRRAVVYSAANDQPIMLSDPSTGLPRKMTHDDLNKILNTIPKK